MANERNLKLRKTREEDRVFIHRFHSIRISIPIMKSHETIKVHNSNSNLKVVSPTYKSHPEWRHSSQRPGCKWRSLDWRDIQATWLDDELNAEYMHMQNHKTSIRLTSWDYNGTASSRVLDPWHNGVTCTHVAIGYGSS